MHTSSLEIEMKQLKALIEEKIQHTYLEEYIEKPVIDEEKLFVLHVIISKTSMSTFEKRQYIITTMLVQIALDTHDLVPTRNSEMEDETNRVSKQLTVLAGDYYSGLYYLLLSEMKAFDMIHILASAIKEINEYKMKLYYKKTDSVQDFVNDFKKIESLLILRVAEYVNEPMLNPIIEDWLITNKLIQEKSKIYNNKDVSPIIDNWLDNSTGNTKSSILNKFENIIKKNTNRIEASTLQLSNYHEIFKIHIHGRLKDIANSNTSIAEEG